MEILTWTVESPQYNGDTISAGKWKCSRREMLPTPLQTEVMTFTKTLNLETSFDFCLWQSKIFSRILMGNRFLSCATILSIPWKWIESLLYFFQWLIAENLINNCTAARWLAFSELSLFKEASNHREYPAQSSLS